MSGGGPAPRGATWLGDLFLHAPRLSRRWPVRAARRQALQQLGGQPFGVTAPDGVTLDAVHVPPRGTRGRKAPVLFLHGYLETKEFHLYEAALLSRHGHGVIMADLRRHGNSGGRCVTFGVRERYDLAAVLDAAQRRGWVPDQVIDIGFSLGGGIALQHAAVDHRVAAVVALAPFRDLAGAVYTFHRALGWWWISVARALRGFERSCHKHGFEMADASALAAVRQLRVPVLFAVGMRDRLLPDAEHTAPLAEAHTGSWHRHIRFPRAAHANLCYHRWPGLDQSLVEFCGAL